ncbi:WD repeat-containing protein 63 [Elysia marginata]|uniref:WD repeat-containing protein 63 n=1 Tax=Elysia marginata TaxID=1093978 RepID=A0AAV4J6V3_9GAST|nr:WD repeat-containing protein 63 [Elysia marginata]
MSDADKKEVSSEGAKEETEKIKEDKKDDNKEAAQTEEKEKDSSEAEKNANSNAEEEPTDVKKPEKKASKVKNKPGKKESKVLKDEPAEAIGEAPEEANPEALPENVFPLFMTSKTQEIYNCKCDEDVTEENPFKFIPKSDILEDMKMRAAVCDFHPFKQQILDYPGEDVLIVYDFEFKHGQNFIVALTEEAKELLLKVSETEEGEAGEEGEEEEEDDTVYMYIPPEPKDWVSLGSEKEIDESTVKETRRKLKVSVKRIRRDFGAPTAFADRNVADVKDGAVDCTSYDDNNFDIKRIELDKAVQAISEQVTEGTQTDWKYPRNANTQTYPREYTEDEQAALISTKECSDFVNEVAFDFHQALQQNEIMNVFYVDWVHLGDGDDAFGSKADNHLKEYQSFTDLQFSKDKMITCIQWHRTIKGVVATSVAEKLSFDQRIDHAAKVIMTPSLILIWSFADPIHPQLILEAPDDIFSFAFNPTDPNHIVGGCLNGQIVMWDIAAHADRLKQQRGSNRNKKRTVLINKMGVPQENASLQCTQLLSCATDHCVMLWDTKASKMHTTAMYDDKKKAQQPSGVPDTFKHLDLIWKPILRVTLSKSEPGGDHAPTKFSIQERQGDRSALSSGTENRENDVTQTMQGGFHKPSSGKERTLQGVKTYVYVGTEDGEIVYADWMPQKDQDTGKIQTPKPAYYHVTHDGPVVSMQRSPFFKDILLSVGGWTLALWKEGVSSGPILESSACHVKLSCAAWSPTRPGVFFVAKVDGSVDVWDLLDKTHEPALSQSVSPTAIMQIYPFQVTQKQQLIAVGDIAGTLHILEIPWSLRQATPNETTSVANYIEREVKRRAFVVERWNFREKEKRELEADTKRKAGGMAAAMAPPTEEEKELRLRQEYEAYLNEEHNFLRELGIVQDEEIPLPAA